MMEGVRLSIAWVMPIVAALFYVLVSLAGVGQSFNPSPLGLVLAGALLPVLFGAVFAAVHHAEVIAHRTGEPYGTLILTAAVTIIEVALITSIMMSGEGSPELARDAVFAVVMIVCNGLVGLCIIIGGLHHREQSFRITGANSYLMVLMTLATLTLVLPNYTLSVPGPVYSPLQIMFVSAATIVLYAAFLYIQTVRHRDYFVEPAAKAAGGAPGPHTSNGQVLASGVFLLLSLSVVVLLAKKFAAVIDVGVARSGAPPVVIGVLIALLVLLPEATAALRAARQDQLQKSINLALGSSLATIGLTIPAVAAANLVLQKSLVLGLEAKDSVLLVLTFGVSILTFATGRTNILSGFVHLVLFATYVFLLFAP